MKRLLLLAVLLLHGCASAATAPKPTAVAVDPQSSVFAAARATIELNEEDLAEKYAAARRAFDPEGKLHNPTKIQRREELQELEDQLRNLRESDAALRDAFVQAQALFRQHLLSSGVPAAQAAKLTEIFGSQQARTDTLVYSEAIRPLNLAYFDMLRDLLNLIETNFQDWQPVLPTTLFVARDAGKKFRFNTETANARYQELTDRIDSIVRAQRNQELGTAIALEAAYEDTLAKARQNSTVQSMTVFEGTKIENEAELRQRGVQITRIPKPAPAPPPSAPVRIVRNYGPTDPELKVVGPQLEAAIGAGPRARFGPDGTERPPEPYVPFRHDARSVDLIFRAKSAPPVMKPGGEITLPGYFGAPPRVIAFEVMAEGRHAYGNHDLMMTGIHRKITSSESRTIDAPPVPGVALRIAGTTGTVVTLPRDLAPGNYALVIMGGQLPVIPFTPLVYDFEVSGE